MDYRRYSVRRSSKAALLDFIARGLEQGGCRVLKTSDPSEAPFRITFEDSHGLRHGVIVYAFFANSKDTKNRPSDEHRFQIKYGKKDGLEHEIWQDPYQIYTTLLVGIDLEREIFVGIDPVLHQFTKFFISIEFKRAEVEAVQESGWHCWERTRRSGDDSPVEVMVGGKIDRFFDYVQFEQSANGIDQGHRFLLAENLDHYLIRAGAEDANGKGAVDLPSEVIHHFENEFEMPIEELLGIIQSTPRLLMPVRGWVAERHLKNLLEETPGVDSCIQIETDGKPDFEVVFQGGNPFFVECKNVLRRTLVDGTIRVDFQKTRASKSDPCSRFYRPDDFEVLAACLHPCTERWEFRFRLTSEMALRQKNCLEHLENNVRISEHWSTSPAEVFSRVS